MPTTGLQANLRHTSQICDPNIPSCSLYSAFSTISAEVDMEESLRNNTQLKKFMSRCIKSNLTIPTVKLPLCQTHTQLFQISKAATALM